jgi:hypothetical protein
MVNLADIQRVFRSQALELSALGITIPGKCAHTHRINEEAERTHRYYIAATAWSQVEVTDFAYQLLAEQPTPGAFGVGTALPACQCSSSDFLIELHLRFEDPCVESFAP